MLASFRHTGESIQRHHDAIKTSLFNNLYIDYEVVEV